MREIAIGFILFSLVGAGVLALATWPLARLAGARTTLRRRVHASALAAPVWCAAFFAVAAAGEAFADHDAPWLVLTVAVPVFALAAALAARVLATAAPLPRAPTYAARAGVGVALAWAFALTIDFRFLSPAPAVIAFTSWTAFPLIALTHSARRQRRLLKLYEQAGCPNCGYEGGAAQSPCPECGTHTHLCWNCRRFVKAAPGEPCPNCNAKIAARCWNCDADWTGVRADQCPECSTWIPLDPQQPHS